MSGIKIRYQQTNTNHQVCRCFHRQVRSTMWIQMIVGLLMAGDSVRAQREEMTKHGIVSDVVDEAPSNLLEVKYPEYGHVRLASELSPEKCKDRPTVDWPADDNNLYTLAMIDPDAPSRRYPKAGEWKHWLVVNIPGNDIDSGQALAEYTAPTPPKSTGKHRYVFLVFKQKNKLKPNEGSSRPKFSIKKFADKHRLGKPVAGNFFFARNEESWRMEMVEWAHHADNNKTEPSETTEANGEQNSTPAYGVSEQGADNYESDKQHHQFIGKHVDSVD